MTDKRFKTAYFFMIFINKIRKILSKTIANRYLIMYNIMSISKTKLKDKVSKNYDKGKI